MANYRIKNIAIQGFRSFGSARQSVDVSETIAVFWGGNSQGKTSFAEALEFLFTGQIARRELLASTKDEFTEALRNAHLDPSQSAVVEAVIHCADGSKKTVSRQLLEDYKRGVAAGCISRLSIDGTVCTEADLERLLGIRLSHPPLRVPILAQHTLAHVFSVAPTERAAYFRALLDTQDLEDFRNGVASLSTHLKPPQLPLLADLAAVEAAPAIESVGVQIRRAKSEDDLRQALATAIATTLRSAGVTPADEILRLIAQFNEELGKRRAQTFPLDRFARSPAEEWQAPPSIKEAADAFFVQRDAVEAETRKLTDLFKAVLGLSHQPTADDPIDCPLCGTADSLTVERIQFIREQLKAAEAYTAAAEAIRRALEGLDKFLEAAANGIAKSVPKFMRERRAEGRAAGFTVAAIGRLVDDPSLAAIWLGAVRPVRRAFGRVNRQIQACRREIAAALGDEYQWRSADVLIQSIIKIPALSEEFIDALSAYAEPAARLGRVLTEAADRASATKGWEALAKIAETPKDLWEALQQAADHATRLKSLEKALADIDAANGRVLDAKFTLLSDNVRAWWDLLRPDESAFFTDIGRRGTKTRRNVDVRVGLATTADRSDAKIRDAIAVFSQSQLHCLGLSLFLARVISEGRGFVVLDDPVLTSDDDYRPNFIADVVRSLLDQGIQVILCTQDYSTWKSVGTSWQHRNAGQYQFIRDNPLLGTEIRSSNDDLAAMLARAAPATRAADPGTRKEGAVRLREAIERFCKIVLVKNEVAAGNSLATVSDYDGQNFGNYGPRVMAHLTVDPSHPGKLKQAHNYVTPGPHDDKPPSSGELKMAYGDIKALKKVYLD